MVQTRHHRGRARGGLRLAVIDRRVTRNPAPIHPSSTRLSPASERPPGQQEEGGAAARPWHLSPWRALRPRQTSSAGWSAGESHEVAGRVESAMVKAEYEARQERAAKMTPGGGPEAWIKIKASLRGRRRRDQAEEQRPAVGGMGAAPRVELAKPTPTRPRRSGGAMVIDKTPWLKIGAPGLNPVSLSRRRSFHGRGSPGERFVRAGKGGRPDARDGWRETTSSATREWSHEQSGCPGAGDSRRPGCSHRLFGIDIDCSRHIFRHAAATDPAAFATIVKSLAEAVRQDARFGTAARIRRRIAGGARP